MTLTYTLALDILKVDLPTKMKFLGVDFQKLEPERDTQTDTDRQTDASKHITSRTVECW